MATMTKEQLITITGWTIPVPKVPTIVIAGNISEKSLQSTLILIKPWYSIVLNHCVYHGREGNGHKVFSGKVGSNGQFAVFIVDRNGQAIAYSTSGIEDISDADSRARYAVGKKLKEYKPTPKSPKKDYILV